MSRPHSLGRIETVRAFAPGRVNLIGDHTDYTGGLALPMAVEMGTTVTGRRGGRSVVLSSDALPGDAVFDLPVSGPLQLDGWGRYVEAVAAGVHPESGLTGRVTTDLPIGAGLSSSASLEVAVALALGHPGPPLDLARTCQEAEHMASGVPCGLMDQLVSVAAVEGQALLIDFTDLSVRPVPVPPDIEVVVIHSGEERRLAASAYAERRRSCEEAAALIGPLRRATLDDVDGIADPVIRARARHVVGENTRVLSFAEALAAGDPAECGRLMLESHRSLSVDFSVSTPRLDAMVADLSGLPGVYGARLTGAGFGGCVVVLARPGAVWEGWRVRPSGGARVTVG
ncbi:MAG TPA: galactokinase family protein [Acidimicrobiales bacterium]|nr:galactokinase family protein [Acidimicrobiales bacterium]